jgi:hypothetical protein
MNTDDTHWFDAYCIHHSISKYADPPTSNRGFFRVDMAGEDGQELILAACAEFYKQLNGRHNIWLRTAPSIRRIVEVDYTGFRCYFRGVYW